MVKQRCGDKAMECLGLDHPGQNKKERPNQNNSNQRRWESKRPGLDHPGRNKQQEPPPRGLDHLGPSGGHTFRTGSSGTDQAAGAAAPRTGSSGDKLQPAAPDWIIGGRSSSRSRHPPDWFIQGQVAADVPDWIIRRRRRRSGHNLQDWIIRGKSGLTPRAGLSGVDQAGGAPTPWTGTYRGKGRPEAKET